LTANDEDLQLTKTGANGITIGSSTSVDTITFGAMNLVTTGAILGGVNILNVDPTSGYTLTAANAYGSLLMPTAAGEITLPAGAKDMAFAVRVIGAHEVEITPNGSEVIVLGATTQTGGDGVISSGTAGEFISFVHNGTNWYSMGVSGTWVLVDNQ
jgi:hypothetical protein